MWTAWVVETSVAKRLVEMEMWTVLKYISLCFIQNKIYHFQDTFIAK